MGLGRDPKLSMDSVSLNLVWPSLYSLMVDIVSARRCWEFCGRLYSMVIKFMVVVIQYI